MGATSDPEMQTVRFPGLELQLESELTVSSSRSRPGESEITGTIPIADRQALCAQLVAAGFQILEDRGNASTFSLLATRGHETVTINAAEAWGMFYAAWTNRDLFPAVHIVDGYFAWDDRAWPAYFDDGVLAAENDDSIAIEARISDPDAVLAWYRTWARAEGFEIEDPQRPWDDEPDVRVPDGLRFRSARYTATLEVDGDELMLFLSLAPGA